MPSNYFLDRVIHGYCQTEIGEINTVLRILLKSHKGLKGTNNHPKVFQKNLY